MKTLISTRFYKELRNARNNRSAISLEDMNDGYLDFLDNLIELSGSDRSLLSIIRCIEFTLAELTQIKDYLIKTRFPAAETYIPFINKGMLMLEKELKLISASLRYPHINELRKLVVD